MYEEVVAHGPYQLEFVPDHIETQEMCKKALEENPLFVKGVPDHFKTQEMYEKVIEEYPHMLC